jgi:thiol-disulfide isomerase/thioredoxin
LLIAASICASGTQTFGQDSVPKSSPAPSPQAQPVYDEAADAEKQIAAALAKARRDHSRVLIQWGANWCGWCVKLHGFCASQKEVASLLRDEFVLVKVDVGQFDRHQAIWTGYGATLKESGIPYLTVLGEDGKVVTNQETGGFEKDGSYDKAKLLSFLNANEAPRVRADEVLKSATAAATAEHKKLFVHFGAPWCGWCHKLESWMARPEIGAILAKDFIDVKIDTQRMGVGGAMHRKMNSLIDTPTGGGIPWYAFTTTDGSVISDSNGPHGNTGYPGSDEEVAHFLDMVRKARTNITDDDLKVLESSLREASAKNK